MTRRKISACGVRYALEQAAASMGADVRVCGARAATSEALEHDERMIRWVIREMHADEAWQEANPGVTMKPKRCAVCGYTWNVLALAECPACTS